MSTQLALELGDDALIASQRLSEWLTRAPSLEEEVALANIALDLLGQARALLNYVGDEDALAYRRAPEEYRCVHLVERPIGDFAVTIARLLAFSAYQYELYHALSASEDELIAGVAGKAIKEVAYHRDHAVQWTLRLGRGTEESHRRMQAGLEVVWPDIPELFADRPELYQPWAQFVRAVLAEADLSEPVVPAAPGGGRNGVRTPEFAAMHEEMTALHLAHPGASW